jgi:hypothetical protein
VWRAGLAAATINLLDLTVAGQQPYAEVPVRNLPPLEATRDPLPERFARRFERRSWRC